MPDIHSLDAGAQTAASAAFAAAQPAQPCEECLGSGGWYRYEPSAESATGLLYLSCVHCRGSGHGAPAQA